MATTYNVENGVRLKALQSLAQRVDARLDVLEAIGAQANILEGVKVNGTALIIANKIVNILIATGATDGTLSVNGVDVAVKGLAALAYKAEVSKTDLATALQAEIDAKAKQTDLDTLTGSGEGSIAKMIDDAFNDFSAKVTDDGVVNSYKELIDWAAEHGAEAAEMAAGISENKTAIANLKEFVGELPEGATSTTVVAYIAEAIAALGIGDYAKAADLTALAARVSALETKKIAEADLDEALAEKVNAASEGNHSHANKAVLDSITAAKVSSWDGKAETTEATALAAGLMSATDKAKLDGIEFAPDEEVEAMLDGVFGTATAE